MEEDNNAKRKRYVSKACDICRIRHLKCDGNNPCSRCVTNGIQCMHEIIPNKRGPTAGKSYQLEAELTVTKKELEEQKQRNKQLEQLLAQYMQNTTNGTVPSSETHHHRHASNPTLDVVSKQKLAVEYVTKSIGINRRIGASLILDLCSYYNESTFLFSGVPVPQIDWHEYWNGELDPRTFMLINSILAESAINVGNVEYARTFYRASKDILKNFRGDTHTSTAASYFLLGVYHQLSDNEAKAIMYNSVGHKIVRNLLCDSMRGDQSVDNDSQGLTKNLFAATFVRKFDEIRTEIGYLDHLYQLQKFCETNDYHSKDLHKLILFLFKIRYLLWGKKDWAEALLLLDEAHLYIPVAVTWKTQQNHLSLLMSFRGVIYHVAGNRDLALQCCYDSLNLLKESENRMAMMCLLVCATAVQVLFYEHQLEYMNVVKELVKKYDSLPFARKITKWIVDPVYRMNSNQDPQWALIDIHTNPFWSGYGENRSSMVDSVFPGLMSSSTNTKQIGPQVDPFLFERPTNNHTARLLAGLSSELSSINAEVQTNLLDLAIPSFTQCQNTPLAGSERLAHNCP